MVNDALPIVICNILYSHKVTVTHWHAYRKAYNINEYNKCVYIYVCAHVASCLIQKHFKLITMKAGRLSEIKTSGSPKAAMVVCIFQLC